MVDLVFEVKFRALSLWYGPQTAPTQRSTYNSEDIRWRWLGLGVQKLAPAEKDELTLAFFSPGLARHYWTGRFVTLLKCIKQPVLNKNISMLHYMRSLNLPKIGTPHCAVGSAGVLAIPLCIVDITSSNAKFQSI